MPRSSAPTAPAAVGDRSRFGLDAARTGRVGNFGALGAVTGALAVALLVGGLVWSAATGQAPPSQRPRIFGGSLVLDDYRPLTAIDLATGSVTVQLEGVYEQVGAKTYADVQAVATSVGTMLVNTLTGTFNMLGKDDYVLGPPTNGISLGPLAGETGAAGFADGASTYIVRYAPTTTISLVDESTVEAGAEAQAAGSRHAVRPVGFAQLGAPAADQPGGAAVSQGALWLLTALREQCGVVTVAPSAHSSHGLAATGRALVAQPCAAAALESVTGTVGLVVPGRAELFGNTGPPRALVIPGTVHATQFLPVLGASGMLWYLVKLPSGWSVLGIDASGLVIGPMPLADFGPAADPVVPAYSGGRLYTLDQAQRGQPALWVIQPGTGAMQTVRGAPAYPAKSVTEKASFVGAQVLVDGPRVVFNNPESLLAVVVFTDGSHAPVIVDKSNAVIVSAAGPGDVNVKVPKPKTHLRHPTQPRSQHATPTTTPTTVAQPIAQPIAQPVTQQVDCATTTEKPYEPQISSLHPSDESVLVTWTYHLLDEEDCLPRTWSVTLTALYGRPQPLYPVQVVNGQQQLLFTGLRPATSYRAVVTAYINNQSTESTPASFTTTAVGPGAPAFEQTVANGRGGWVVSWEPCSGPQCMVPAVSWTVVGSSCGPGFVGVPPKLTVKGDQKSVVVNVGNDLGLLGDSLSFSVQGVSAAGLLGAPASDGRCSQAWESPDPADLQLLAAGVPDGQSVTAELRVVVVPGASSVLAFGGDQVSFSYSVGGQVIGPTPFAEVDVPGLDPAKLYQATATVTPLGHPSAAVTLTSPEFAKTIPWPSALRVQVAATVGENANTGTVIATFQPLPPGRFEAYGNVTCGSEILPVYGTVNSAAQLSANIDLDQMGGSCTMSVTVRSTAAPDPYGVPSPLLRAMFSIGARPTYGFNVVANETCSGACKLQLDVSYDGIGQPAGTDWQVVAASRPGCAVVTALQSAARFPLTFTWPTRCTSVPTVTVEWLYLGQPGSAVAALPGLPPPPTAPTTTVPTTTVPTTTVPTTTVPTTTVPTTLKPTTTVPTTLKPTTLKATTTVPTTLKPTTLKPTTLKPTTTVPTTTVPTTTVPTTREPTTREPTTTVPTTTVPTISLPPAVTTTLTVVTVPSSTAPSSTLPAATTTTCAGAIACATTTTATTMPAATTTTSLTTSTTMPAATTTTSSTTSTTVPVETTTTSSTTSTTVPVETTTTVSDAVLAPVVALGGPGPRAPGATTEVSAVLWALLAAVFVGIVVGAMGWGFARASRGRKRTYPLTEATT